MRKRWLVLGVFTGAGLGGSFARALEKLGHEVFCFDYERAMVRVGTWTRFRLARRLFRATCWDRMNLSTREVVDCVRPDLVLAVKATYLDPDVIRGVRRSGALVVNYYPDNPYCGVSLLPNRVSAQRHDLVEVMRQYDRVYIWESTLAERLKAEGVQASVLPFGVDPELFRPGRDERESVCTECPGGHEAVFVGQYRSKRGEHVAAIRQHSVSLWGPGWSRLEASARSRHYVHKKPLWGNANGGVYAHAKANLNILDDLNMPGHNMRTFEIPAAGGVMLATFTREQSEFFPEHEAAAYYRSPAELDDKIRQLIQDDAYRERLREGARSIASRHTYTDRMRSMAADLEVGTPRRVGAN